jgi:PTH1 family peptidyl-tRNA hydrolase
VKLIVGLGNPGREYARTRHNVGFRVVDCLAKRLGIEIDRAKFKGEYAKGEWPSGGGDRDVMVVKPQTYMNLSGETVIGFMGYFKIDLADLLVVVDDVALALGALRIRRGGSDGGHNGLKDITLRLGTQDYARLRVGVGGREAGAVHVPMDLADHVLSRFSEQEEKELAGKIELAADACQCWAEQGVEPAMNKYNLKVQGSKG